MYTIYMNIYICVRLTTHFRAESTDIVTIQTLHTLESKGQRFVGFYGFNDCIGDKHTIVVERQECK